MTPTLIIHAPKDKAVIGYIPSTSHGWCWVVYDHEAKGWRKNSLSSDITHPTHYVLSVHDIDWNFDIKMGCPHESQHNSYIWG